MIGPGPDTRPFTDQFAGAGGTSTGLVRACQDLGIVPKLYAFNHDPIALETHRANYPFARHFSQEIEQIDPRDVIDEKTADLFVSSPTCTFYSSARGGKPVNDQLRQGPFQVVRWAHLLQPRAILVENVPEFVNWAPLLQDDTPDPKRKGLIFRIWVGKLRAARYEVAWRKDICAADYGDATTRTRFFLIARRDGLPLRWPTPTHAPEADLVRRKWRAAWDVLDHDLKGRSLFAPGSRPLARPTWMRITYGCYRFGCEDVDQLVDQLAKPLDLDEDVKRKALRKREQDRKRRGLSAFTMSMASGGLARDADLPIPSPVGKGSGHRIDPFLLPLDRPLTNRCTPRSINSPMFTAVGSHERTAMFEPFVVPPRGIMGGEMSNLPRPTDGPMPTATQRGGGHLLYPFAFTVGIVGRGPWTLGLDEPLNTLTHRNTRWLIEARATEPFGAPNFGENESQDPRTLDVMRQPMWATTSHGAGGLIEPFLSAYYGTGDNTSPVAAPVPTATTKDRLALVMPVVDGVGLDIFYRMIQNHETAAAMSFPKGYKFAGNRTQVTRQIGNAVAVETARALCRSLMELPKGKSLEDFAQ